MDRIVSWGSQVEVYLGQLPGRKVYTTEFLKKSEQYYSLVDRSLMDNIRTQPLLFGVPQLNEEAKHSSISTRENRMTYILYDTVCICNT